MFKTLKFWRKLVVVKKSIVWVSILSNLVAIGCSLCEPIAFSYFINFATEHNTALGLLWLGINLLLVGLDNLAWHINYSNYTNLIGDTYISLQSRVFAKVLLSNTSENNNLNTEVNSTADPANSKAHEQVKPQLLDYVINSDIFGVSTFADTLIMRLSGFLKMLIMLVVIFFYSFTIGAITTITCVIGFALMALYGKQKTIANLKFEEAEMNASLKADEIINKSDIIKKYNLEAPVLFEQERRLKNYVNSYNNLTTKKSVKDNYLQIYWYAMLTVILVIALFEFNNLMLSLAVFLVLIDYCSKFIKITENAFNFKLELNDLKAKLKRLAPFLIDDNTITNTIKKAQQINELEILGNFKENGKRTTRLVAKLGEILIFKNDKYFSLFESLNETNVNFNDGKTPFNLKDIKVVNSNNEMLNDTALKNLLVLSANNQLIKDLASNLNIEEFLNENVSKNSSEELHFLFNLCKAILVDDSIVFVNLEPHLNEYKNEIIKTIKKYKKDKIFVIFDYGNIINQSLCKNCRIFE